jgi:hypothetical protein
VLHLLASLLEQYFQILKWWYAVVWLLSIIYYYYYYYYANSLKCGRLWRHPQVSETCLQ